MNHIQKTRRKLGVGVTRAWLVPDKFLADLLDYVEVIF